MWKSTAGSDLAPHLPPELRPAEGPSAKDFSQEASSDDGFDSFRDASFVAELQPRPKPQAPPVDAESRRNRWKGADEFEGPRIVAEPFRGGPTDAASLAGAAWGGWLAGLGALALVGGAAMFYFAANRVPPPVPPRPADPPAASPVAMVPTEDPKPATSPAVPGGDNEMSPVGPVPMVAPALPPVTPEPRPTPLPVPLEPVAPAPTPPLPSPPVTPVPAAPQPAVEPKPALPPELQPLSSPRAETLLSMARQLEASGRLEAAIRRYEQLVEKFRGTAVADEAQSRLNALKAPK